MSFSLTPSALHEVYAGWEADGAAACGLGLGVAAQMSAGRRSLWVRHGLTDREIGAPYPPGLAEWGLDPREIIFVCVKDIASVLQAGLEGAGASGVGVVVIELWGETRLYDLTASRRLALAARASGATALVMRAGARPQPSAAETRWRLRSAPSRALAARAPGRPVFELTLLRARNGQEGASHRLEWNRDERRFAPFAPGAGADLAAPARRPAGATLSGAMVALPVDGSLAPAIRQAG